VLDPIDGTINFSRDSPMCAISLSLVVAAQPVLGIVDAPLLGERFLARRGGGAFLNGVPITVSEIPGLHEAIVGVADFKVGVGSEEENRVHLAVLARLAHDEVGGRLLGVAAPHEGGMLLLLRCTSATAEESLPKPLRRSPYVDSASATDGISRSCGLDRMRWQRITRPARVPTSATGSRHAASTGSRPVAARSSS
jgi:hypothetical protein